MTWRGTFAGPCLQDHRVGGLDRVQVHRYTMSKQSGNEWQADAARVCGYTGTL
jgi:hypothetical protein